MTDVYIGTGHGRRPNGGFDPGALTADGSYSEHEENHQIVVEVSEALHRSGVSFVSEHHGSGGPEDPNYRGSIDNVNAGSYRAAIELHHDWYKAPDGGFGLYVSDDGEQLARAVGNMYNEHGLPRRDHQRRADLSFLTETRPPALIWECDVVAKRTDAERVAMGEAIAEGICNYLGLEYVPPDGTVDYQVAVVWSDDADFGLAALLGRQHAFKVLHSSRLDGLRVGYAVAVGSEAKQSVEQVGGGRAVQGRTRHETADLVHSLLDDTDVDRSRPWSS